MRKYEAWNCNLYIQRRIIFYLLKDKNRERESKFIIHKSNEILASRIKFSIYGGEEN